jgi:hypothetical protein
MSRVATICTKQVVDPAATFLEHQSRAHRYALTAIPDLLAPLGSRHGLLERGHVGHAPHERNGSTAAETEILVCTSASHGRVDRVRVDALHTSLGSVSNHLIMEA